MYLNKGDLKRLDFYYYFIEIVVLNYKSFFFNFLVLKWYKGCFVG